MKAQSCLAASLLAVIPQAGSAQCIVQRLTGPPSVTAAMGQHVGIEGDHLIVSDIGAYTACGVPDPFRCSAGATYAFRWDDGAWVFEQLIVPDDIGFNESFGGFHIEGDRMMIARPWRLGDPRLGHVLVYEYDDATRRWIERDVLVSPGFPDDRSGFGAPAVFSGDLALVSHADVIHRYVEDAEGWQYQDSFGPPDGLAPLSNFGHNIAIGDEWVFISADQDSTLDLRHGSVYVYRREADNTLTFVEKMLPPDLGDKPALEFGYGLAFDGTSLAISSPSAARPIPGQGVIYIFELVDDQWTLVQELTHSDAGSVDLFGQGIDIDGDTLIAGPRTRRDNVSYVFRRGFDGVWREVAALRPGDATPDDYFVESFGFANAVDGNRVVVGAHGERQRTFPGIRTGAAYAFDLSCEICEPDLDADGRLTVFDFLTYLNLFDDGDAQADFDGDGELTIFDFLAYQTAFDAGCP